MLPSIKFGEKRRKALRTLFHVFSGKNSYLRRRTYSDTSAELVEARVGLKSLNTLKTVTATPEQPVNVSELLKSLALNKKASYE